MDLWRVTLIVVALILVGATAIVFRPALRRRPDVRPVIAGALVTVMVAAGLLVALAIRG